MADRLSKLIMITFISKAVRKKTKNTEFPGGTVVRSLSFHCLGLDLTPGQGTKISQNCPQHSQKKKEATSPFAFIGTPLIELP